MLAISTLQCLALSPPPLPPSPPILKPSPNGPGAEDSPVLGTWKEMAMAGDDRHAKDTLRARKESLKDTIRKRREALRKHAGN